MVIMESETVKLFNLYFLLIDQRKKILGSIINQDPKPLLLFEV